MRVGHLKINHIVRPMGYLFDTLTATYLVEEAEGKRQAAARILVAEDEAFAHIVYDTGRGGEVSGLGTPLPIALKPRTRYFWKVQVWDELGNQSVSGVEWFETALLGEGFDALPVSPVPEDMAPVFLRRFSLDKVPERARLYISCLGVYEVFLNGERLGEEWLAPGLTVYTDHIQYQTYDVGGLLRQGENLIEVSAGDGWYRGKYGYRQNGDYARGKKYVLIGALYAEDDCILRTDTEWRVRRNPILESDIYDGEVYDACLKDPQEYGVAVSDLDVSLFQERIGMPVVVKETLRPKAVLHTPAGETVLDMGQNMTGRVSFVCREPKGTVVTLEHGEILQNGCFYNGNYRTAKARYRYISDGVERETKARLTFFGFQYVLVTGIADVRLEDFCGEVLYSDLEATGELATGHGLLNGLISNILWSQKGNFLDIPTDCPQRDEKMGWTGDAQIFAGTACLNMECYPFFRKYLRDISAEQRLTGGLVPQIVPSVGRNERTSAAWGDAAVVIPWTLYRYYGDCSVLEEQYGSMRQWLAYIDGQNAEHGTNPQLWQNGFHYGDWLALDGGCYHMPTGGTECYYVSSAFFYHSASLVAKAAGVLGKEEDASYFSRKAEAIRQAILREYFTETGRLVMDTQTGYILALVFDIVRGEQRERVCSDFLNRLKKDEYRIRTGFAGTPFLLEALSRCGRDDLAYRMLLEERCPGWLYPVTMGATTMWERWDAVNPDGSMSDSGMNSLNHYALGSVEEWMYAHIGGIVPAENGAGFSRAVIAPALSLRLKHARIRLRTAAGIYEAGWEIKESGSGAEPVWEAKEDGGGTGPVRQARGCGAGVEPGREKKEPGSGDLGSPGAGETVTLKIRIPFNARACVYLPLVGGRILVNGAPYDETGHGNSPHGAPSLQLDAGAWEITYPLAAGAHSHYSMEDSVEELIRQPEIKEYLYRRVPMLEKVDGAQIQKMTLGEMSALPFFLGIGTRLGLEPEILQEIEKKITKIEKKE